MVTKELIKKLDNLLFESKDNQKQCLIIIDEIVSLQRQIKNNKYG